MTTDCGSFCFVTDNGGGSYNSHDVDNGYTVLSSPIFDATLYVNPQLNYFRRYLNIFGKPQNDTMKINLSNGIDTVLIEAIDSSDVTNGTWVGSSFQISALILPTANMQLTVKVSDFAPGNLVEGALDQFEITGQIIDKITPTIPSVSDFNTYPNPFNNEVIISYNLTSYSASSVIRVKDILGREVFQQTLYESSGKIHFGKDLIAGIYLVTLENSKSSTTRKIVKE